jgi:hypothetical protein
MHFIFKIYCSQKNNPFLFSDVSKTCSLWNTTIYSVPHIGNYLGKFERNPDNHFSVLFIGAIKKWVDLQNSGDNLIVMLADLHTVTIPRDPDVFRYEMKGKYVVGRQIFVDRALRRHNTSSKSISSKNFRRQNISSTGHFVDRTLRRQDISSTEHFVDITFCRQIT